MNYLKILLLLIIITFTLASCKNANNKAIDESYNILVKESELFVRIIGNVGKPIIIYLHGGPGGFSTLEHELYRNYLETDYLIAYLDQRGCGQSKELVMPLREKIQKKFSL